MPTTRVLTPLPAALLLSFAMACSSSPPPHQGSSLSQAADEAKKTDEEKKKVLTTTPEEEQEDAPPVAAVGAAATVVELTSPADSAPAPVSPTPASTGDDRVIVSLLGGGGGVGSEDFDGFGVFGVGVGARVEKRLRADFSVLYMPTQLSEASDVVDALTDEKELALDLRFRYYVTPAHTFAGLYGVVGARAGWLLWNYANEVTVEDDNGNLRTLEDDRLTFYAGYLGVGVAPVQTEHIMLGVDLDVGLETFESYTSEGFKQDLFDDFIEFTQLLFSADYRF